MTVTAVEPGRRLRASPPSRRSIDHRHGRGSPPPAARRRIPTMKWRRRPASRSSAALPAR